MEYFIDDTDRMERLLTGTATEDDQIKAGEALIDADIYADVYSQLCDLIEPHVQREYLNPKGELPASVVHSVEFLMTFWLENKK